METSFRISAKAERLVTEGRVEWVKGHVYRVRGDNDTYTVHVSYPQEVSGVCDCPSKGVCSHLIAACGYDLASPPPVSVPATDPFEGIN